MTLKQYINRNGITLASEMIDTNPNMADQDWRADHYRVTLKRPNPRRQLTTYFSMGMGLAREPQAEDVLDCLASDASGYDNASGFESWAADYGYDTDSRKAEKTYRQIERAAAQLQRFLGDGYETVLYKIDRL